MTEYANSLRISGYSEIERYNTIRGAVMRWKEMNNKVKNRDIASVNRSKTEIKKAKLDKGGLTARTWYLKGNTDSVITVQPTPGGKLATDIKVAVNSDPRKRRIMVTEDGGVPAISSLRKSDPFKPNGCRLSDPECMVEGDRDCTKSGIIYEITCIQCSKAENETGKPVSRKPGARQTHNYIGMIRTSCHWRMKGHLQGQKAKHESNALHRHDVDHHNGEVQKYRTRILHSERNLLPLCLMEEIFIENQNPQLRMNDRNEAGRGNLVRIIATRVI